jgi:transcriptional regulator with XRE-family HTH domain
MLVGERLAAIRKARNVSLRRLASVLGTTADRIRRYESGAERISPAHVIEICQFFQIKVADLFPAPDPDPNPDPDQDPKPH